jgi:hypothetical protein
MLTLATMTSMRGMSMGELARRRRERDRHLSRSQLAAVTMGSVMLVTVFVALAYGVARRVPAAEQPVSESEELVDLLARVDAAVVAHGSVDTLTFPDTLTGVAEAPALPVLAPQTPGMSAVAAGVAGARPFDLVIHTDESDASVVAEALRARGWQVKIERGESVAALHFSGAQTLIEARADAERLRADLATLDQSVEVELLPR